MGVILGAAYVAAALLAVVVGHPLQDAAAPASPPLAVPVVPDSNGASLLRVPATTIVDIEIMEPLSSKTATIDATFPIRLVMPVMVDGRELIPAGTTGVGQVVHAARSGGGGRAGELLLAARYLDLNGVRVPLRRFRLGGSGAQKTDEAFAAGMVVAFGQLLVRGKEIEFPAGTRANAIVAADTDLSAQSSLQKGE